TGFRGGSNIGTEPGGLQMRVAPACDLRDERRIPGAAGRRDRAGDVIRKDAGQYHLEPPSPSPEMEAAGGFAQIGRKGARARDHVAQDVPLRAQDHQRAQPDVWIELEADNGDDKDGEGEI